MKKLSIIYNQKQHALIVVLALLLTATTGCKKLLDLGDNPLLPTPEIIFSDSTGANSALAGIYGNIAYSSTFTSSLAVNNGLYTDELSTAAGNLFESNALFPQSPLVDELWFACYYGIYAANSAIEGIQQSGGISATFKSKAIGEARFLRALFYFYLTGHYGDVPLVLSSNVAENKLLPRSKAAAIYEQIVLDLKEAAATMPEDYGAAAGERVRANRYAAAALLAKACLFTKDWPGAEAAATMVIDNKTLYDTVPLAAIFYSNSREAVLQLQSAAGSPANIASAFTPIPGAQPQYLLKPGLLNGFEAGDLRKTTWVGYSAGLAHPAKYKTTFNTPGNPEYYTLLRLADVYLARAEAHAHRNQIAAARDDLNVIRKRARLGNTTANDEPSLLAAIEQERRVELFCETGDRFYDLRRTGRIDAVLGAAKPGVWKPAAALYPVPAKEISVNPNLKPQNPGYNP